MKNTEKMTYAVALTNAIEKTEGQTRETLERLLESINKRNAHKATSTKPTKKQVENEGIKEQVREVLRNATEPMPCGEIAKALGLTPQKVNALLIQLNKAGEIAKSEGKKKVTLFALATTEGE